MLHIPDLGLMKTLRYISHCQNFALMVLWNHYEHSTRVSTISFSFTTRYYMYSHSQYFKHARRKHLLNHHTLPNKRERKKEIHKTEILSTCSSCLRKSWPPKKGEKKEASHRNLLVLTAHHVSPPRLAPPQATPIPLPSPRANQSVHAPFLGTPRWMEFVPTPSLVYKGS